MATMPEEIAAALAEGDGVDWLRTPLPYSRPARTPDGAGGSMTVMGTPTMTVICDPILHQGEYLLRVPADEDIRIGDLVKVPFSQFQEA